MLWRDTGRSPDKGSTNVISVPSAVSKASYSPWSVSRSTNPVDDSKTTVIQQGSRLAGGLLIRCGKKLDAYFNTPNDLSLDLDDGHRQSVRVRYGTKLPIKQTWIVADSFDALFAPSAEQFLGSMVEQGKFAIEYRVDGLTDTATFMAADLGTLLNACCPAYIRSLVLAKAGLARERERVAKAKKWENPGAPDPLAGPTSDPPR
jgi:hypothetical protein